jgi:phosphatidylglycerol:prolipoprotein diacylglycerol transferase
MIDPVAFRFWIFEVHWYGILITTGILVGAWVVSREVRRRGLDPDHVWNALIFCVILGVIGARLYHVLTPSPSMGDPLYYLHHPIEIFYITRGGLGIYGAIAGGILAVLIYARRVKLDPWIWLDLGAPGLALGQAIGRWGNFINQELYGRPTDLPWGIYISPERRLAGYTQYERFHPTFLYESLWNLGTFVVLFSLLRRRGEKLLKGEIVGLYAILYSAGRILLEFVRLDSPTLWGIPIAQIVAAVVILFIGGFLIYRRRVATAGQMTLVGEDEDEDESGENDEDESGEDESGENGEDESNEEGEDEDKAEAA